MKNRDVFYRGAALMLLSATLACTGQLLWKLSARNNSLLLVLLGLALYGGGGFLMIVALRYGDLSMLHPMTSSGYVMSLLLGAWVLEERVTPRQITGVILIILGLVFISSSKRKVQG